MRCALLAAVLVIAASPAVAADKKAEPKKEARAAEVKGPVSLVFCAPGYMGSTAEAQPSIDALVKAMATTAKWDAKDLTGAYYETDKGGVEALARPDAAMAMVTLAFFLEQQEAAKLDVKMLASMKGRPAMETWALVAKKGAIKDPAALDGYTIASGISYSPRFIRGPVLGAWGKLPESVSFKQVRSLLPELRKAGKGEKIAVIVDEETAAALPSLTDVEVVYKSPPVPTAVVATVGGHLGDARWKAMAEALNHLAEGPDGAKALEAVQKLKFFPLDDKALAAAQKAFKEAK